MKITLVGMGMGNPDTLTRAAWSALEQAQRMIGARRLLEALPPHFGGLRLEAVAPQAILRLIEEAPQEKICVVFSGDTGFYSGAKKVTALLQEKGYEVKIHCGVSTVQYLAAQLGRSWQDVRLVSAHGVDCDVVGQVLCGEETFFLTGGDITPQTIIHRLCAAGLGGAQVTVGEALSYPDERIITQPAQALLEQTVVAGLGNIYADESLFRAGIDPRRPAGELSEAEAERLRCALQEVLRESIAQCGSSIRDYRDANGNVGAFQNTFFVYGRGGQLCRRCGTELEKGRIAGRATVFCPQCQK